MTDDPPNETTSHSVWNLPTRRSSTQPVPEDLAAVRAAMDAPLPDEDGGMRVEETALGGVDCVLCTPESPIATVLYLHGGGFRLGSARRSAAFGASIAALAGARVVVVDYALAPEQPYPSALGDAAAVYDEAVSTWPGPLLVAGDSAGGGLAASLVLAALGAERRPADGLVLLSPWVDLTVSAATFASRSETDRLFSRASAEAARDLYLQGWDPLDPLVSPVFADLGGFPPTLVFAGGDEVLLDDALALTSALARAGVSVEAHVVAQMQHVWPTLFPDLPESGAANATIARFIGEVVARCHAVDAADTAVDRKETL